MSTLNTESRKAELSRRAAQYGAGIARHDCDAVYCSVADHRSRGWQDGYTAAMRELRRILIANNRHHARLRVTLDRFVAPRR